MNLASILSARALAPAAIAALLALPATRGSAAPAKPAEIQTIGGTARPDAVPADPHAPRLVALQGSGRTRSIEAGTEAKPAATETRGVPNAQDLSAAQRAKLATGSALAVPDAVVDMPSKPGTFETILAPAIAASRIASPAKVDPLAAESRPARTFGALGAIPRPEWSSGATGRKPADVSTIERAAGVAAPAPEAATLQRRAAPTAASAAGAKPAAAHTALPRDPAAPAAGTPKPAASKEVQP